MDKLNLYAAATANRDAVGTCERLKFYESSVTDDDGGRLISVIAIAGDGLRMTEAQAQELHDWLDDWLNHR